MPEDGQGFREGRLRRRQVVLRLQRVADFVERHREVPLPAGIARVLFRQPPNDGQGFRKGRLRRRQVALRLHHVADPDERRRQPCCRPALLGSCAASRRMMARDLGNMLVHGLSIEEITRRLRRDLGEVRDKIVSVARG